MGERIVKLRKRLEWSQAQMARELGVSQPTIWRIEHGLQKPSKSLLKLLDILDARLRELTL